jgi:hypothetical protein
MPFSIVFLLKEPRRFTKEELQAAAESAWGKKFDGIEDPMYFVFQQGEFTIVKPGAHIISVLRQPHPYADNQRVGWLPRAEQKKAWMDHTAWASLDLVNSQLPRDEAYKLLATLAIHLVSVNCSGIYLPKNSMLFPNDGTLEEGLYRMQRGGLYE